MEQLKAQVYDCLVNIQNWQNKLAEINKAIVDYKEPVKDEPKETKVS